MKRLLLLLLAVGMVFAFSTTAYSTDHFTDAAYARLNVSATVIPACSVETMPIDFGEVAGGLRKGSEGGIKVSCVRGLLYFIALDAGQHLDAGIRNMEFQNELLPYKIFKGRTRNEWGDNDQLQTYVAGSSAGAYPGTGGEEVYSAFGYLMPGYNVPTGTYTDTVKVTVWY
jgi:spore coat protein U-like protein